MRERLSENFYRDEFACKCGCGFDDIDMALVHLWQKARDFFDVAVTITSGCRCPEHNARVGGSPNSQHLLGKAGDGVVSGVPASIVQEFFETLDPGGLGAYTTFTHVDTREGRARW